jgi:multidrug resistance efflux pump
LGAKRFWLGIAGAILAVGMLGCGGTRADRSVERGAPGSIEPRVRRGDFVGQFLLTGELKAVRSDAIVIPRNPTWRTQIRWIETDGARVSEGDRVVELDNSALVGDLEDKELAELAALNALEQKIGELDALEADKQFKLEQARVELEKAEIEAAIPEELRSRREHQEKQLALERARAARDKARRDLESFRQTMDAELEILRIALEKARRDVAAGRRALNTMTLRAPRDGILVIEENRREDRKFQVGDSAWVGLTIARLPDLSEMQVEASLSDVDDGRIGDGDRAVCIMDAYPDLLFDGIVAEIAPVAQETSWRSLRRAFRVLVDLDRTDEERMRPGMSVKVEIETARIEGVLIAPRAGLDLDVDPPRARLAGGSDVEVTLGPCDAFECVVEEGLSEGAELRIRG